MAAVSALIVALENTGVWNLWTIVIAEVAVLTIFSALGGALFERRVEIDHEPVSSPERRREREDREHAREISAMLDGVYAQIRIKRHERAREPLRQWLATTGNEDLVADVHTIVDRVAEWRDADALSLIVQTLAAALTKQNKPDIARETHRYALRFGTFDGGK